MAGVSSVQRQLSSVESPAKNGNSGVVPDEAESAFLRLFIALAVPPEVRREIGRAQARVKREAPPGTVRWTRPEQFHVTLKFLGDVPQPQTKALQAGVSEVCAVCSAPELFARGIGFFPNGRKPHVIWVRADDPSGRLAELHRRMEAVLQPFAPPDKPGIFIGHITLGRFKPGARLALKTFWESVSALSQREFGCWPAGSVEIMRSELTATGAVHSVLASFPLAQ
jgi:2'-5' RNA ligase